MKRIDLTNTYIGKLHVLEKAGNRVGTSQSKTRWIVECFCGSIFETDTGDLTRKDGKARISCGCLNWRKGTDSPFWSGHGQLSLTYFNALRRSAEKRGIPFELSIEQAYNAFVSQQGICTLTGRVIDLNTSASIDRIDSRRGYLTDNIQWLHKDINRLKSNWTQDEFIALCKEVTRYNE